MSQSLAFYGIADGDAGAQTSLSAGCKSDCDRFAWTGAESETGTVELDWAIGGNRRGD